MKKRIVGYFLLTVALLATMALPQHVAADEACHRGVCVQRTFEVEETTLHLLGMSRLTFWGFRVYTGALFTPEDARTQEEILGDVPKRLYFKYHRSISRDDILKSKEKFLRENPDVDLEAIADELKEFNALYRSVSSGDVYELIYHPEKGTTLVLNGEELGTVKGAELARAIFGLWISDHPLNDSMKRDLLSPHDG